MTNNYVTEDTVLADAESLSIFLRRLSAWITLWNLGAFDGDSGMEEVAGTVEDLLSGQIAEKDGRPEQAQLWKSFRQEVPHGRG